METYGMNKFEGIVGENLEKAEFWGKQEFIIQTDDIIAWCDTF